MAQLDADHQNMQSVLEQKNSPYNLRLAGALGRFWFLRGYWKTGLDWLESVLDASRSGPAAARAKACASAASLAWALDEYGRANELAEESLHVYRSLDDQGGAAFALSLMGIVAGRQGDHSRAASLLEESLTCFRALGDDWGIAYAVDHLAFVFRTSGNYDRAFQLHQESLELRRAMRDQMGIAVSLSNLGDVAQNQGDWISAVRFHKESLGLFRLLGDSAGKAYALGQLGMADFFQGQPGRAMTLCRESLEIFWEIQDRRRIAESFYGIAQILASRGEPEIAVRVLSAAFSLRAAIGAPLPPTQAAGLERLLSDLCTILGEVHFQRSWLLGKTMGLDEVVLGVLKEEPEN